MGLYCVRKILERLDRYSIHARLGTTGLHVIAALGRKTDRQSRAHSFVDDGHLETYTQALYNYSISQ